MNTLNEVRVVTQAIHLSLDDHPLLVQFMSQGRQPAYQSFLQTFSLLVHLAAAKAAEYLGGEDIKVLEYESWGTALQADLERLPDGDDFSFAERYTHLLPDIKNRSQFWGLAYVIEGSTLGGNQVSGHLPKDWPSEFLRRGSKARLRWPYFCRRLADLHAAGEIAIEDVKNGAMKGFLSTTEIFDAVVHAMPLENKRPISLAGKREAAHDRD